MDSRERRRDVRARIALPVSIVRRGGEEPVEMLDASYRGLFLRIASPPPLRELVKLRVTLPGKRDLEMHAVVVRVVGERHGEMGVGLRFFALNGNERAEWESFIHDAVAKAASARAA